MMIVWHMNRDWIHLRRATILTMFMPNTRAFVDVNDVIRAAASTPHPGHFVEVFISLLHPRVSCVTSNSIRLLNGMPSDDGGGGGLGWD